MYKVVCAGYNCFDYLERSLRSIEMQNYSDFEVCVVDDASTDERQPAFVKEWCEERDWKYILREQNGGALVAQLDAIRMLDPQDGDVLVWVDADDALANDRVFSILDGYYSDDVLMTYGSYQSEPHDPGCSPAQRYPRECEKNNDYRNAYKWGIQFNHLRTISWDLFKHLDDAVDFRDANGDYFPISADFAFMIPCLELAGGRYKCIKQILYLYSSDNPISEWRKAPKQTNRVHDFMIRKIPPKQPLEI